MRNVKLALGVLCLSFLFVCCCPTPPPCEDNTPKLIYEDNYFEGTVYVPEAKAYSYGLLRVNISLPRKLDEDQPILAIIYDANDLLLNQKVNFQLYRLKNPSIIFAKIIDSTNSLTPLKEFESVDKLVKLGFIDLHVEGKSSTNGGQHSKIHILNPTGKTIPIGLDLLIEIEYNKIIGSTVSSTIDTAFVLQEEFNTIFSNIPSSSPNPIIYKSFETGIIVDSINRRKFNISLEHTHTHDPKN